LLNLQEKIAEFARYHQTVGNRVCHYIGIPLITIAVLGALATVDFTIILGERTIYFDMAIALLTITLVYDLNLSPSIAVGIFIAGLTAYVIAKQLSTFVLIGLFCIGWVMQLTGHRHFEHNNPAFTDNLLHMFIGPRWLINELLKAVKNSHA
jgi:uncharacterized membrane protein YGL010W